MLKINDSRISFLDDKFYAKCICGKTCGFTTKLCCLKMLKRGSCRYCKKDYRNIINDVPIYQNKDKKWCSICSGCGKEQAYTRKDHAKQSELSDWRCKKCVNGEKKFNNNRPVGDIKRLYNKFRKSANKRKINWNINIEDFEKCFTGKCKLTGWDISMSYSNSTASFDRINSSIGYEKNNIQWVHKMVNMCKNKYEQKDFIKMCKSIALNN